MYFFAYFFFPKITNFKIFMVVRTLSFANRNNPTMIKTNKKIIGQIRAVLKLQNAPGESAKSRFVSDGETLQNFAKPKKSTNT